MCVRVASVMGIGHLLHQILFVTKMLLESAVQKVQPSGEFLPGCALLPFGFFVSFRSSGERLLTAATSIRCCSSISFRSRAHSWRHWKKFSTDLAPVNATPPVPGGCGY
jgi:hypothetical protein